jgi:hypothetical protein
MIRSPLTSILLKIFVSGFYRVHAGFLTLLFGTVICYCFFIIPLNQTHLSPPDRILENLIFTLTLLSSPLIVALVFLVWLFYTFKSWQYIARQLRVESHQFLFYSVTSLPKARQFQSWFIIQLVILLPAIGYALMTIVVGLIFEYYWVPAIAVIYLIALALLSAWIYVRLTNELPREVKGHTLLLRFTGSWKKPFFSLFFYHLADRLKIMYSVTKTLSLLMLVCLPYFFNDVTGLRSAAIIVLMISMTHVMLVYQSQVFEDTFLSFARNFAYSRIRLYINFIILHSLLLLPEGIILLTYFPPFVAAGLFLFSLSILVLCRCLLYRPGITLRDYLWWITILFTVYFILVLFNQWWWLGFFNLLISYLVFHRNYYETGNRTL